MTFPNLTMLEAFARANAGPCPDRPRIEKEGAHLEEKLRHQREADEYDELMGQYCASRAFLEGVSFRRWQGLDDF